MKQLIALPLIAIILLSGCANQNQSTQTALATATNPSQETAQLREVELGIEGLWCESCVYGIQSVMNTTPGIQSAEVKITDYIAQTGTAKITYNPSQITKEQIANLTDPYSSKIVKDNPIKQQKEVIENG